MFYSPEDLDRIKKIQIFQSKRFYKYNFNLKLLKSGVEIELKISKIDAKTSSIHFLTVDRKNSKTALYEIPLSSIGSFQKNEYERCVTDHILSHLQMKENGLVYVSMEDQKKSLFLKKETISLINFEKDFELHFLFDSERKFIQVLCYENREFKLEIPIKDDSSHNKLQQLCDKILLEIVVLFKSGAPQFFPSKDYSLDHYEILDEKKFDSQNTRFCTTKIIEKEGSIYLINTNKQKNINGLIQEACFLGKKENKPQILDKFQKSQFKKLLYDREFFGIDDTEFFEQMKEDDKSLISSTNSKSLIYSSKPNTEEDLNEAASKIQSQYKKKNKDQTQKKPIAINNDPKKDISLRTIREETETRNSHETNFDETSFNKKDDSNIQGCKSF